MSVPFSAIRVLIVDSQHDALHLMGQALTLRGMEVTLAPTGAEGLQCFYDRRPDCVVVDLQTPDLNSYQLTRAIRGDPKGGSTPLIVLSALAGDQERYASLLSGSDLFLSKPVTSDELYTAIQQALSLEDAERRERLRRLAESPPPNFT